MSPVYDFVDDASERNGSGHRPEPRRVALIHAAHRAIPHQQSWRRRDVVKTLRSRSPATQVWFNTSSVWNAE